jgi:hypothetical protein
MRRLVESLARSGNDNTCFVGRSGTLHYFARVGGKFAAFAHLFIFGQSSKQKESPGTPYLAGANLSGDLDSQVPALADGGAGEPRQYL